jgi:NADH-quinone oxidoreductase subunit C
MTPVSILDRLRQALGPAVGAVEEFRGGVSATVEPARILEVCRWLKFNGPFELLSDLAGVDHYGEEPRFEVAYVLYSLTLNVHLRLKVRLPEETPEIDSVVPVWSGADWHEREAFDMYGIVFRGHPNLKRILMWPGYPYYPLRKDFPLAGLPADLPVEAEPEAGVAGRAPMAGGPFVAGGGAPRQLRVGSKPSSLVREPRQYDHGQEQLIKLRTSTRKEPV